MNIDICRKICGAKNLYLTSLRGKSDEIVIFHCCKDSSETNNYCFSIFAKFSEIEKIASEISMDACGNYELFKLKLDLEITEVANVLSKEKECSTSCPYQLEHELIKEKV